MIKVKFRKIDLCKDINQIFEYMMKEENQILFSHAFQINTIEQFRAWLLEKLSHTYHDFFMIEDCNGDTIGFTFSYEFMVTDRHCKYTVCIFDKAQDYGAGAIASIYMMNYLFEKYPLKRLFTSVFDYNLKSISSHVTAGFKEVAVLPDYRYYNGDYHSLHIFTVGREEFYKRFERLLNRMKK